MKQFSGTMPGGMAEGLQAMIDGLSGKIPQAVRNMAKGVVKAGRWALPKGSKQPVPFYLGTAAHDAIAAYYRAAHAGQTVLTNMTPMKSILGRRAGQLTAAEQLLKPDITSLTTSHLYEIKPRSQAGLAIAEANMYLALFQKAQVPMNLGPVNDSGTVGVIPAPAGHYSFQAIAPGAIVYDYRKGDYDPAPVPVPVPVPQEEPFGSPLDDFVQRVKVATGLSGGALLLYLLVSELSRVIPARDLIPVL